MNRLWLFISDPNNRLRIIVFSLGCLAVLALLLALFLPQSSPKLPLPPITPSTSKLTPQEKTYPQVLPPPSSLKSEGKGGELVATSGLDQLVIIIDPPQADILSQRDTVVSTSAIPFRIEGLRPGWHILELKKPGYEPKSISFQIEEDKITRVDISLTPIGDLEWVSKLPIKDPLYYIDYDPPSQTIKVLLYPLEYSHVPKDQQVEFLKNKVNDQLQQIGVNTKHVKIEWEIQ